jgi:hypothetical protein
MICRAVDVGVSALSCLPFELSLPVQRQGTDL